MLMPYPGQKMLNKLCRNLVNLIIKGQLNYQTLGALSSLTLVHITLGIFLGIPLVLLLLGELHVDYSLSTDLLNRGGFE